MGGDCSVEVDVSSCSPIGSRLMHWVAGGFGILNVSFRFLGFFLSSTW